MSVTSINSNPSNDSKYARRRSLRKGTRNQLREVINEIISEIGEMNVRVYAGPAARILYEMEREWEVRFGVTREVGTVMGYWAARSKVSAEMKKKTKLHSDLELVWVDFNTILARRLGNTNANESPATVSGDSYVSKEQIGAARGINRGQAFQNQLRTTGGAGAGFTSGMSTYLHKEESVVVFALADTRFDLIVSKYGYGDGAKENHHFFHWQAREKGGTAKGTTHTDDLADH
ncbi:hypothetical protein [Falsiroseomonas oryziterrae]|uniref:hypothetical protein n=1 Tax=Falsiroseomonas oryziterrae TaxID=2911368 RepID=UPI001F2C03DD|nr:hypothetical protein [Roseomonas sp. NPKOSM-4]